MDKNWLLYGSTIIVGWMLLNQLYTGRAIVSGTRVITRIDNPLRYWFWIIFYASVLAVLIFAWVIGIDMN